MRRPRITPLALAGLPLMLAGCIVHVDSGGFTSRDQVRVAVEGVPTVDLSTFDGAIEVRSWSKAEVLVEIESRASSRDLLDTIDIDSRGDKSGAVVHVTLKDTDGWRFSKHAVSRSARLIATVPAESRLRVNSGDGSVRVVRVRGTIEARTDDGRIVMREVGGDVVAHTGDGSVQVEDVDGRCRVSTRDGSVLVAGRLQGGIEARSGDGSVTIRAASGTIVDEDWHIETGDGGVVLTLPDPVDARLDLETGDGRIALAGFPELSVARDGERRRRLQAVLGDGQATLRVRTSDGTISLKRTP
ncbi:MAG: DUF4097 family beta strand repeat protein [Acidobacteria bacterium]|nr:DUF4097 family beta strand repeat protein [Acidobacteriota bacterium]